jgi:hypothetical protein
MVLQSEAISDAMVKEEVADIGLVQAACSERQVTREMRGERVQLKAAPFSAHAECHRSLLASPTE